MTMKRYPADPGLENRDNGADAEIGDTFVEDAGGGDVRCHDDSFYEVKVRRCKEEHRPKPKPCPEPCYKPCYIPCYTPCPEPCHKPCYEKEEPCYKPCYEKEEPCYKPCYEKEEPCYKPCYEKEKPCYEKEEPCRKKKRHECREVLLNAATGGAGPLPAITTPLLAPIQVVSVTIDPDKVDDLAVLLNFTSIISSPLAVILNLNFQVLRSIDGGLPIPIGPQFTFARAIAALEADSFGFQVFDRNIEGHTVTYSVVLASTSLISVAVGVTIVNATLSALGVEG